MYDDNLCQMKVHLSATSTIPTIVITNVLQLQSRTTVSSSVTHLISWRHAHSWCTVSSYSINPYNINIFYRLILPCGVPNWTSDQDSLFALAEMKQTICIYFTYHIWHHLLEISYERESEKCHPSTLEQIVQWARYSMPHNYLNICDRKLIFVSLPMFIGSRKPVLTFTLQLKKLSFFKWLQWN